MTKEKAIYFDMDGTLVDFYGVNNWLEYLNKRDTMPYTKAKAKYPLTQIVPMLKKLQNKGYIIGIVSWLAKDSTQFFDTQVTKAKCKWLSAHMKAITFDEIHIVPYGTDKKQVCTYPNGILFDDNLSIRKAWGYGAYADTEILTILKELINNK